jgi:transposase
MLLVEDRFVIQDLFRAGVSVSEIARRTGHDRKTVRRVLAEPLLRPAAVRAPRPTKLDPFAADLEQRLAAGVLNARKLYAELQQRGYTGRETQVRAFVAARRPPVVPLATVRFETPPGEQAQCDWGHFGAVQHAGVQRRLYAFVMTLGFSRCMYLEFTVSLDTAWWLRCHQHAFTYFGGVPREVLHDNLKSAVLERDAAGIIHWNARYLDFATHCGFRPHACAPYRAQTKGKVENGVGYVRKNFWPGLTFRDLADLNAVARTWLDSVANQRRHGTTGLVPFSRLAAEQLAPLRPGAPYDTSVLVTRRSSRDCLVSYDGNLYSVPAAHAGQDLLLRATESAELVVCTLAGSEIARHRLATAHGQRVVVAAHYVGLPGKRPARPGGAIQVGAAAGERPPAPEVEVRPLASYDVVWKEAPDGGPSL